MAKRTTKANNAFLIGSILMIVLVLLVVVLFIFLAFKIYDRRDGQYSERYEIRMGQSLTGCPTTLYMNDSLLFQGTPGAAMTFQVDRFAQQSTILVVDGESDVVTTVEMPVKSARIIIEADSVQCLPSTGAPFSIPRHRF